MPIQIHEIEEAIRRFTHRKISNLQIVIDSGKVVIFGQTDTFYTKSLAQQGIREMFPKLPLKNSIAVG